MTHSLHRKEDIDRVREALEADCGGRCNAEYNPCAARSAIRLLDAGKDVEVVGVVAEVGNPGFYLIRSLPYKKLKRLDEVYAITQPDKEKTA